ncbi:2-oxoacid:acceptor oxidoreductase family protein [Desulforamulus ferrireducens]|uniref:2-oxoglutarate ferredoxin oxidoreductase subunit gamma n=1 Tax=Desulforamulus ferrireducens TaxID=1833852 RepID=A0A1S6IWC9_9FIRM|nr:2-oxoacid:acceptor oxidoreductase family protein [Desulforamulus ferrireducens]AQS59084.1 2-oxoglutarate ferredoxin oxidoreductase subunit gamma [Desulforamulus ferrireducens]
MPGTWEVRLSGSGGQGLILAGIILAEAAIIDGQNVVQTQSYGPAARGGASKAEVIISPEEIDYPKVERPDVFLGLNQESVLKYMTGCKENALAIVDAGLVSQIPPSKARVYALPITETARKQVGRELVANVVALGALTALSGVVSKEAVSTALLRRVPKGTEEMNRKALELGFSLAEQAITGAVVGEN